MCQHSDKLQFATCNSSSLSSCFVLGQHLQKLLDHVVRGNSLALGREIGDEAVAKNRRRHGSNIVRRYVVVAVQHSMGLGSKDEIEAGARPSAPGQPFVNNIRRFWSAWP